MASPASSQASGSVAQRARPAKSGPFTAFEDAMLLDLVAKHGDRWSLVAHGMAGRGIDQCKLRHEELRLRALATQAIPAPGRPPAKKKHGKKSDENAPVPVPVAIPTSIPLPAITMPARPAPAPVVVPVGPLTVGASMRREKDAKLPRLLPKPDGMTTRRQAEAVPLPVAAPLAPQREVLGERINAPDDRSSTHSSPGAAVPAHRPCASATVIARERNQAASSGQKRDQQNTAPGSQSQQPSRSQQRMTLASLMTKTQPSPMSSIPPMRIGMPGRPAMPSPGPGTPTTPQPDTPVFQTFHDQHLLSAARASFDEHLQSAKRGSSRRRLAAPRPKTTTTRRTQSAAVPAGDESTYAGSVVDGFGGSQLHYDAMSIGEQGSDYDFGADMGLYSQADLSSAADWNDDLLSSILGVDYAPPSADFGSMNDDIFGMDSPFSPERNFEVDSIFSQPPLMPMPVAPEPITARKRTVPPLPPLTIPRANPSAAGSLSTQQRPPPLSADQDPNAAVIEELLSGIIGDGSDAGFFAEEPVPFSEQSEPEYRADDVPLDEELELLVDAANPTSEPITVDAVLPTDAPIYSRTRQRLSLENFDLQTLENMLPYSILESLQMDADQVRYSSFVKSLHQQHLATDGAAMSPFPHDEDDGEFRATEVDEEDLEYAVPHEEIESLLKENEAFDALGSERMDGMAWAGNNGQRVFTEQQIATLRMQMAQSFQIAAQAYALQAALHGTKSKEAGVWKHQLQTMKTDAEWSQKVSRTQYRENSHVSTPGLAHVPRILSLPVDPAAPKAQAFVQKFNYPYTRKEIEKYRAKAANGGDKGGKKELTLPESVQKTIDICKGVFSKDLLPEIIRMRKGRMLFSSEEDALLAIGVSRFGPDDWNEIQAYCLPTRTVRQLKARYTFLISRRAPETDVKRHYLSPIQPLKLIERELLVTGFKQHGAAFQHMLERVFPRYPKALVTRTWDALHAIEQIPVSYAEACEMAPAPVFEDPPPVLRTDVILCRHAHAEVDLYTIAGAGLDYLEQSIRLLQNERNLPSKDLRSRLSKGLQHAVVGGKICPLYAHSRIGPKNTLDVSGAMPKRKVEAIEGLAQQRQKRLRV